MKFFFKYSFIFLSCLSLFLSACFDLKAIYNTDIRQGNFISSSCIKSLKIGMTKNKVKELIGKPTLIPITNSDYWCYYYYNIPGVDKLKIERHCLILKFSDTILVFYELKI